MTKLLKSNRNSVKANVSSNRLKLPSLSSAIGKPTYKCVACYDTGKNSKGNPCVCDKGKALASVALKTELKGKPEQVKVSQSPVPQPVVMESKSMEMEADVFSVANRKGRVYSIARKYLAIGKNGEVRLLPWRSSKSPTDFVRVVCGRINPKDSELEKAKAEWQKVQATWNTISCMLANRAWPFTNRFAARSLIKNKSIASFRSSGRMPTKLIGELLSIVPPVKK